MNKCEWALSFGKGLVLFHLPNYLLSILENWLHKNWISPCDNNVRSIVVGRAKEEFEIREKDCGEGGREGDTHTHTHTHTKVRACERKWKYEDVKLNIT